MPANGFALGDWTLSEGALRAIGREFHLALVEAGDIGVALPSDGWLNARLLARGCPQSRLQEMRDRIRQMHFAQCFESSKIG
jgi:hypothetical protein